jgi:hypothetical protein
MMGINGRGASWGAACCQQGAAWLTQVRKEAQRGMQAGNAHAGGCAGGDEEAAPGTPPAGARQPLARRKKAPRGKLGLLPLVALIFYEVSGGPFGTEVRRPPCCVRADSSGGPGYKLKKHAATAAEVKGVRLSWRRVRPGHPSCVKL